MQAATSLIYPVLIKGVPVGEFASGHVQEKDGRLHTTLRFSASR
jgi:hypothetical protein